MYIIITVYVVIIIIHRNLTDLLYILKYNACINVVLIYLLNSLKNITILYVYFKEISMLYIRTYYNIQTCLSS